jgi:hypothetical protein
MSKNLKIKKVKEGNLKTLIITNNDNNKKFSLRNVKTIFNKLIIKNNLDEENIQIHRRLYTYTGSYITIRSYDRLPYPPMVL